MATHASNNHDYDSTFKILVLGDSGVGKTCLIYRYTEGIFSEAYVSTIGNVLAIYLQWYIWIPNLWLFYNSNCAL